MPTATYMLSSGRLSNPRQAANALVEEHQPTDGCHVSGAFALASTLPKIRRGNVGAGFSQLINVTHAPHGGYYVRKEETSDWSWDTRMQKARSDIQFRRRISRLGGPRRSLPHWFSAGLIYLNHNRDNEFGHHLEEQR